MIRILSAFAKKEKPEFVLIDVIDQDENDNNVLLSYEKNTNSSALDSVNHRVEETILNCDLDLSLEEDKKSIISNVEVVEMKENDIELHIWAQFVRSYSEYKQGSQINNRHENLDVSTKVGLSHSTIHDKTKTMLSDFE